MPGALTHTMITWSLLPIAPQVPGVTPEALLMERCATGILIVSDVLEHCLVVGCVKIGGGAFGGASNCRSFALV